MMTFLTFVILIILFLTGTPTFSAPYSIEGILTYEGHGLGEPQGYKGEVSKRTFQVVADGCKWTIKTVEVDNTNFSYFLSTYDGTNLIYLDRPSPAAFDLLRRHLHSGVTNLFQSCAAESIPVPRTITDIANAYPWLAFASGYYLRDVTNGSVWDIRPLNMYSVFAGRRQVPCHFQLSGFPPYLPISLEYRWTNVETLTRDGRIYREELPPVFGGSFVSGQLKSEGFTNVGGFSFPMHFEMREYTPFPHASSSNDFRCTVIVKGTVTSIATTGNVWSDELPDEVLSVNDYRFYTNAPVPCYLTSNAFIPPLNDPKLASVADESWLRFRAIEKTATAVQSRATRVASVIRILLVATALVPIILFLLWKFRTKQTETHNKG